MKYQALHAPENCHPVPCHAQSSTLLLGVAAQGELEVDVAASKAAVDLGVGIESVVNPNTLLLIEDNLEDLAAVFLGANTLANNLDGEAEIGQDGVVDSSQCAGARALLLLGVARAGRSLGAGQDAARGEDQHMAVRELLLELTGQAVRAVSTHVRPIHLNQICRLGQVVNLPLLSTVETLQGRDGDKDDYSLLAVANFDLIKTQSQHASSRT